MCVLYILCGVEVFSPSSCVFSNIINIILSSFSCISFGWHSLLGFNLAIVSKSFGRSVGATRLVRSVRASESTVIDGRLDKYYNF